MISQPGVPDPEAPFVIGSGTDPESPSAQLMQTARGIAAAAFGQRDPAPGPWVGLSRLAYPIGIGEQAAIRRRRHRGDRDQRSRRAPDPGLRGRGRHGLLGDPRRRRQHVDRPDRDARRGPATGPGAERLHPHRRQPGPGLDALAARDHAADRPAADRRRHLAARAPQRLADQADDRLGGRARPAAARRAAARLPARARRPDPGPGVPLRPGLYPPGSSGPIAFAALAAAVALAALLVRPMRTPLDVEPQTLAAAAGLLTGLAIFGIWLLNPYLALLLAPAAHVWLPAARASGPPRASALAIVALLSLIPALVAFATVAGQLDLGAGAPWQFLLLIEDGQVSLLTSLLWCALLGGLISCVAAAGAGARALPPLGPHRQHPRRRQPRRARCAGGNPAGEPPPRLIRRSSRHGSRRGSGRGSGRLAGRSSEAAKAGPAGVDGGGEGHQDRKCESTPSEVQCVPTMNNSRSFKTRSLAASTRSTRSASQSQSWNGSACCRVPTSEAAKVVVSCYRN